MPSVEEFYQLVALVWPEFVTVQGAVLLAANFNVDSFEKWWARTGGDISAVEGAVNHRHLYDDVRDCEQPELAKLEAAGLVIAEAWRAKLALEFPGRSFLVEFATEPDEYGPTLTFRSQDPVQE